MKKFLASLLMIMLALTLVSTFTTSVNANNQVRVRVDGKLVSFPDQRPVIESGRTLVPIRFIAEELGHKVDWNGEKEEVTIQGEDKDIKLEIGNIRPLVNGQTITLDVPAKLVGGRTFVPLRFVSEALGAKVEWVAATSTVVITTGNAPEQVDNIIEITRPSGMVEKLKEIPSSASDFGFVDFQVMHDGTRLVVFGNKIIEFTLTIEGRVVPSMMRPDGLDYWEEGDGYVYLFNLERVPGLDIYNAEKFMFRFNEDGSKHVYTIYNPLK